MKIATYNVNGVNGRLPVLLRWLSESEPDIVVLQELRLSRTTFRRPRSATLPRLVARGSDDAARGAVADGNRPIP